MIKGPGLLPQSGGKAQKLVVLLHGYGSNGDDLLGLAPYWSKALPDVEFLAPNGPKVCEEFGFGYQWFSLMEFTPSSVRSGLDAVREEVKKFLLEALRIRGLSPKDLVLVGFSQGCWLALEMMYIVQDLCGVIGYSGGFYPASDRQLLEPHPEVLLIHGDMDTVVPYSYFLDSQEQLKKLGLHPQSLTCFGLGHSIDEEGIKTGLQFLTQLFDQEQSVIYEPVTGISR